MRYISFLIKQCPLVFKATSRPIMFMYLRNPFSSYVTIDATLFCYYDRYIDYY